MLLETTSTLGAGITGAIRRAARATGASFEYLLKTAQRESSLDPAARSPTSSATGLFQFIDQTWLGTMKEAGPRLGYAREADGIVQTSSGRYLVPDPAQRKAIMRLRTDPAAASAMAAAFTQRNAAFLKEQLGRPATDGELYIAHFLGPAGAVQLITAAQTRPQAKAADLFPSAARANRSIFYVRRAPRSVAQVYAALVAKHQHAAAPAASLRRAAGPAAPEAAATASASQRSTAHVAAAEDGPVFHNLFRSRSGTPVSPVISELWSAKNVHDPVRLQARAQPVVAAASAPKPAAGRPLDLFRFLRPEINGVPR